MLGLRIGKHRLVDFGLFQGQAVLKNDVLCYFSIPLDRFLPETVPRGNAKGVIEIGATRYWVFCVAPYYLTAP